MTITIGKNTVIVAAYLATCIYIYKRYDRMYKETRRSVSFFYFFQFAILTVTFMKKKVKENKK